MPKRRRGARTARHPIPSRQSGSSALVDRALPTIPPPFREALDEVAIVIDDEPSADQRRENDLGPDDDLYGLYEGVPRTEYGADWVAPSRTGSRSSGCRSRRTSRTRTTSPTRSG